jgi:hypothetical protein
MVTMAYAKKGSDENMFALPLPQDLIETSLVNWIRDLAQSHSDLVPALMRLLRSYRALQAGDTVNDAEQILWQAEKALQSAERAYRAGWDLPEAS